MATRSSGGADPLNIILRCQSSVGPSSSAAGPSFEAAGSADGATFRNCGSACPSYRSARPTFGPPVLGPVRPPRSERQSKRQGGPAELRSLADRPARPKVRRPVRIFFGPARPSFTSLRPNVEPAPARPNFAPAWRNLFGVVWPHWLQPARTSGPRAAVPTVRTSARASQVADRPARTAEGGGPTFGLGRPDGGAARPNFGPSRPNFERSLPNCGPARPNCGSARQSFGPARPNFRTAVRT